MTLPNVTKKANVVFLLLISVKHLIKFCMPIYTRNCLTMGCVGPYYHGFRLFYLMPDRSQYATLNNMKSYATPVLSGVPQGTTVLAPLLFLIYINDLPFVYEIKYIKFYADDLL